MSKAADEYEEIARRLKEIEADKQLALTGSTAPLPERPGMDSLIQDSYGGIYGDYACGWVVRL